MAQKKPTKVNERIAENLLYLKLRKIAEIYGTYSERAARENLSHIEYLDQLFSEEAADKFQRRIEALLRRARLQVEKTVDGYDFNYPERINKAQVLKVLDLDFVRERAKSGERLSLHLGTSINGLMIVRMYIHVTPRRPKKRSR